MSDINPYQAPSAAIEFDPVTGAVDQTGILSPKGRFSRVSYLAWGLIVILVSMLVGIVFRQQFVSTFPALSGASAPEMIMWRVLIGLPTTVLAGVFAIRRFHDMDLRGWWVITLLIPVVNLGIWLLLTFARGSKGDNRFGSPRPTRSWEKVLATVLIVLFMVGLLAAILIPAYQAYQYQAMQHAAGSG